MEYKVFTAVRRVLGLLLIILSSAGLSYAQDVNASLSGTVADSTGAAVPNAKLVLTNEATAFKVTLTSGATGEFNFTNLTPGKYDLSATAAGFKSVVQHDIELTVNQQARINPILSVGNAEQTVTVTAQTPELDYSSPMLKGSIAPETLQNFPLTISGAPRSAVTVADMMPGVSTGASGNAYNTRINGGLVTGDEAVVDGATAMEGYMNQSGMVSLETDFGMSPDIASEVTVLTANYPAQYGNTTSGQLIIQTRSGGDRFHGAAYEYLRNTDFNAYQYGAPSGPGHPKPTDQENDFGANIGGPIALPGLHGANSFFKGFFFFNYEGFHDNGGANSATLSLLSAPDRGGNFSGAGSQLYYPDDPAKYGTDAGQPIAYNGVPNQINPAYEDPVAQAWIAALPAPTSSGELNNYFIPKSGQGSLTNKENVYFARVDFNIGAMDHLYYTTWFQYSGVNTESDLPVSISTAQPANPENANIERFNWEHNFSGTMNNHATLGYLNRNEGYYALNGDAKLPTVPGVPQPTWLPEFTFGGGYSQLGNNSAPTSADTKTTRGTWAFNDVFTKVWGRHTITAGYEWRLAGTSIHEGTNEGGSFNFAANTTGNAACPSNAPCPGDAAASFYLGAASNATMTFYNVHAEYPRQSGYAVHAGDSWRVTPKFTADYSLRWDYVTPFKEKYNNLSFFDPNGPNPDAVTAGGTELLGRLAFAGTKWGAASYGAPYPEVPFKKGFAPRVGFAYSVTPKTVVRAGYGIYFGQAFYPGWAGGMSQDGFNKNVNLNQSASGPFQVPALYLSSGVTPTIATTEIGSTGEDINAGYDNGQAPLYRPLDGNRRPYSSQWNFTIQQQFAGDTALTISYVGTKGTHLPSSLNPLNVLDPFNPAVSSIGANLAANYTAATGPATFAGYGVGQPYVGWSGQMTGCAPTLAQALLPYPQYCSTFVGLNEGHANSIYNSFQAQVERRMHNGLYVLGSLTISKLYTNSTYSTQGAAGNTAGNSGDFSPYQESRAWALAPDNTPISGQISAVYDLPIGQGKQFLSSGGALNYLVGGWAVTPLFHYEYGTPMWFSSSNCPTASLVPQFRESCVPGELSGQEPLLHGRDGWNPASDGSRYLSQNAFETDFSTFGYTGFGKAVSTIYGPDFKDLDFSLIKDTHLTERLNFRLAANFFNAFNNHYFVSQGDTTASAFVTDVAASGNSFGTWNGSVSTPRTIQFEGRLEF
jgi:hypothetical protein